LSHSIFWLRLQNSRVGYSSGGKMKAYGVEGRNRDKKEGFGTSVEKREVKNNKKRARREAKQDVVAE